MTLRPESVRLGTHETGEAMKTVIKLVETTCDIET